MLPCFAVMIDYSDSDDVIINDDKNNKEQERVTKIKTIIIYQFSYISFHLLEFCSISGKKN